jgi:cytochrome c551
MNKSLALLIPATLLLGGCGGPSDFTPTPGMTTDQIYAGACARCHGDKGQGKVFGVLKVAGTTASAEEIVKRLNEGGKGMPSFPKLSAKQKTALVDYLKGLK